MFFSLFRMGARCLLVGLFTVLAVHPAFASEDKVFLVKTETVQDRKAVLAQIQSAQETLARARIAGTVSALYVKEGDEVEAGDKIAVIGDPKLAIRGKGLEARIKAARSTYEKAQLDYRRAKELRETGYATQARLDETKHALDVAKNSLQAVEAQRDEVAQQSSEGAVLAPGKGRVLHVPVAVGSVVMNGETIASLSQDDYVLRLELPERHARFLKKGDRVFIGARGLDAQGDKEQKEGVVRLVYPKIEEGRVIADVVAPGLGSYFVGERARVYVETGERKVMRVPETALIKKAGLLFVRLAGGDEVLVQPGHTENGMTEILTGLHNGDKVIVP